MATVSVKQAREKFATLIQSAQLGTPITITCRGRKVATLTGIAAGTGGKLPDLTSFRATVKRGRNCRKATIVELRKAERT